MSVAYAPPLPVETRPTYDKVIEDCRRRLEAAQREKCRLLALPIYPLDHF